ncbi:Crp1p [Saccharomyces eubayanus]|uniref:Crp1p n=1 Tax=Saccharomyces eubayanus TaxID=1080349 RepID=UPI0006C49E91|nr:CRP1-like protein [Saccharomyces eubayanus]KOG99206.1 CRP1-like protein [Saccharomyces eubayanus]
MSNDLVFDYTFSWPAGPKDVILTGTFDEWRGTLPLVKTARGDFEITMPVRLASKNDKFQFKFIVDGVWCVSDSFGKEHVSEGIENNFIQITDLVETQEVVGASRIPEAGGLLCGKPARVAGPPSTSNRKKGKRNNKKRRSKLKKKTNKNNKTSNESQEGDEEEKEDEDGLAGTTTEDVTGTSREETPVAEPLDAASENPGDFHILPIDQNANTASLENFIGGPGPVLVSNPNEIKEFSEIRNVDAKELNERLNKKEPVVEPAVEPIIGEPVVENITELPLADEPSEETKEIAPKVDEPASELETITPVINEAEAQPVPETQESIAEPPKIEPVGKTVQPELVEKREPTGAALDTSKEAESKVKQEETHTLDPTVKKDSKQAMGEKAEVKARRSPAASEEKDKKKKRHEEKVSKEIKRSESTKEKKHSTKEPKKQLSTKVPKKQTASPLTSTSEDSKKKKTGLFGKFKKLFKCSN